MSKPRYGWWGYVKWMIRHYPNQSQRERQAVQRAIEQTQRMDNGSERMRVVEMVFLKQTHTLEGAALMVPCSYMTARRWHNDFIRRVAKNFGLMDEG